MRSLIVVSGGDAPGINLFITHYTHLAIQQGHQVLGASGGFPGVLSDNLQELIPGNTLPFADLSGSLLATSRDPVLKQADAQEKLRAILDKHQIDRIILMGGNGTLHYIPPLLKSWGIAHIGIPTTIDHDIAGTARTLGFDSACNYAITAIDGILATARALPDRIFLVETLGGPTGYLALAIAKITRAHAVLLPEYEPDLPKIANQLTQAFQHFGYGLAVASEGVESLDRIVDQLSALAGMHIRHTKLGHAQRGIKPTFVDRELAINFAEFASRQPQADTSGIILIRNNQLELFQGKLTEFTLTKPDSVVFRQINNG